MNKQNVQPSRVAPSSSGKTADLAPPPRESTFNRGFRRVASGCAAAVGSKWAFLLSILIVVGWALMGPMFHYSDTWQLVINTGTTIVTFLMVFLIQNTQNRDAKAIQLKLDELLRGVKGARTNLVNLEEASDEELEKLQKQFARIRAKEEAKVVKPVAAHAEHAHRKADEARGQSADAQETAERAHVAAADRAQQTAEKALQHAGRDAGENAGEDD